MANETGAHPKEIEFRRRWYEEHRRRAEADPDFEEISGWLSRFHARAAEVFPLRDRLAADGDLDRFRSELQAWAANSGVAGFKGPSGSGFVNSLANRTDDPAELARLLADGLTAPRDRAAAQSKIGALVEHIERVKVGSHPAPGHVPFLLSFFWGMDQSSRWPVLWPGSRRFLELMTGQPLPDPPRERYLRFVDLAAEIDEDPGRFLVTADWWEKRTPVFLHRVLVDRCASWDSEDPIDARWGNADVLIVAAEYLGPALEKDVSDVLAVQDHQIRVGGLPARGWTPTFPREDLWVDWVIKEYPFGLRLWINYRGAAIAVSPYQWRGWRGWFNEAASICKDIEVDGFRMMAGRSSHGEDMGFFGSAGSFVYGRWYEPDQLAGLDLRAEVREVTAAAGPVFEALIEAAKKRKQGTEDTPEVPPEPSDDPLDQELEKAAEDLLVDRSFLEDIVGLLEDKGQVILYGPPGTGKTFLARRLAEALAPDSAYRKLVQFHPSTSYEDFFEGYRPEQTAGGGIGYRLTQGPLARMAEHALEHPDRRHVMVIDEINRANLPRVLGELLFLFEYRDEQASTLYRPDDEFRLPDPIWFIGTMNTADRSIALVDAALRRRFHFVPFFPRRGPTAGLLERWLEREGQPGWVGELVAMVNDELTEALGGDLQLGASHFMRKGYRGDPGADDVVLRRIWEYNIEPFVEDQFFGDADQIGRFRFEKVVARYRRSAGEDEIAEGSDQPGDGTAAPPRDTS